LPRKVFVANEILTAGAVNTNLMDQAVMVFADAAARTAALGSPSEGMVTYLEDTDSLELYTTVWGPVSPAITRADLPAGSVLQVVSTTLTGTLTTSSRTFTDLTGFSLSITPSAETSKILVMLAITGTGTNVVGSADTGVALLRGSTQIAMGVGGDHQFTALLSNREFGDASHTLNVAVNHLDAPSTTSVVTYKLQGRASAGTLHINRTIDGTNSVSTITLMEVAG